MRGQGLRLDSDVALKKRHGNFIGGEGLHLQLGVKRASWSFTLPFVADFADDQIGETRGRFGRLARVNLAGWCPWN